MSKKTKKQRLDEASFAIAGGFVSGGGFGPIYSNTVSIRDRTKLTDIVEDVYGPTDAKLDVKSFMKEVSNYNAIGKSIYRENNLNEVAKKLSWIAESAKAHVLSEHDEWFDKMTINKNMKSLNNYVTEFNKVAKESTAIQQRMESLYEDMGNILSRYYDIKEDNTISEDDMARQPTVNEGEYQVFFQKALKKWGVSSPDDIDGEENKKKFYNWIDANFSAEKETD